MNNDPYFAMCPELSDSVDEIYDAVKEKNDHIPYSFAFACHFLGLAMGEIASLDDDDYDETRADVLQLLDSIFTFSDRPGTLH